MELKANCGVWGSMFGVPCIVADNFLKLATGEQIKVLMYILRNSGRELTTDEIALNTGVSPQQAEDAVMFWQQVNVLTPEQSAAVPRSIMTPPEQIAPQTEPVQKEVPAPRRREVLKPSEISEIMNDSPNIAELFKAAEATLGSINHTMQNSLIWMTNYLGLKAEVIMTLLVYCEKIEKTNAGYIEKIAISWAEKDINTLDSAQEEIERLSRSHDYIANIMKMFEMKRRPTAKQLEIIDQWRTDGYSSELIHYAYEKTIEQIDKLSFEYINKILISWSGSGYRTVNDVKQAENDFKKNKKPSQNNSDDFDADKYSFVINNF